MTQNLIQQAKQVPLTSLYKGELKHSGNTLIGHCPWHEDSTPSFVIYNFSNTYNCFGGCGWGDSIAFWMKTHKVDFKIAVKELCKLK